MIDLSPVTFVSAGMMQPKKKDHSLARKHRYLNYGVLGLASLAAEAGYRTRVIHGLFDQPASFATRLDKEGLLEGDYPLFLSVPSSLALEWSREFVEEVRRRRITKRMFVGGRWVVGTEPSWLKARLPESDLIVAGTAEDRILMLLGKNWASTPNTNITGGMKVYGSTGVGPPLRYDLLEGADQFQPSIEVSRGCGMGCVFCVEKEAPLSPLISPREIVSMLQHVQRVMRRTSVHPYLECSFFRPTVRWAEEFVKEQERAGFRFDWRTESRVDSFTDSGLEVLAQAGLKVLDLGLESASPVQLARMGKTQRPDIYLKKASELVKRCSQLGIWVKVNVLMFAGETRVTLKETCDWLDEHRPFLKGISANPLMLYRSESGVDEFIRSIEQLGGKVADPQKFEDYGFSSVHLSNEFDYDAALNQCTEISRRYMNQRDYFDLKSFSYFPDAFTYEDFLVLARQIKPEDLSFSLDEAEVD